MIEQWRAVPGFPNYEVSDLGRIRSPRKVLSPWRSSNGRYLIVSLRRDGETIKRPMHQLVLEAFIGPRNGLDACHNNGDGRDNRLSNLRWDTRSENLKDQARHGVHVHAAKTHCPQGHPYSPENTYVNRGRRSCKTCHKVRAAACYARKKAAA